MSSKTYYSFLPHEGAAAAAQKKARTNILAMANEHLPMHYADADEPSDEIERLGFAAVMDSMASELTACLGFTCPMKSDACDSCKFGVTVEDEAWEACESAESPLAEGGSALAAETDDPYDEYDTYPSAPMGRGARAMARKLTSFG